MLRRLDNLRLWLESQGLLLSFGLAEFKSNVKEDDKIGMESMKEIKKIRESKEPIYYRPVNTEPKR